MLNLDILNLKHDFWVIEHFVGFDYNTEHIKAHTLKKIPKKCLGAILRLCHITLRMYINRLKCINMIVIKQKLN